MGIRRMLRRIWEDKAERLKLLARVENFDRELQAEVERITGELAARQEERCRAHFALIELQQQLRRAERLAMAGQLAAMVAHEIGTPLHSISGYVQILLQEGSLDGKAAERLKIIEAQVARMVEILQAILTASSPTGPAFQPVDLNQLVQNLLDLLAPVLSRKAVTVSTALSPDLPPTAGNVAQLQLVFLHLLTNALDAMPEGGTLRVASRRVGRVQGLAVGEPPKFGPFAGRPSLTPKADLIEISVADTGRGIPVEVLGQIFEPFFLARGTEKGTGLGLPICQRIVKAHKGRIRAESRLGEETTFFVALPALEE